MSQTEGEKIPIVRLVDALKERNIFRVDLWKLDVEGYEIQSMEGAEEMLGQKSIKAMFVELAGPNGVRVREYLSRFGYACHLFDAKGRRFKPAQLPEFTSGLFLPA